MDIRCIESVLVKGILRTNNQELLGKIDTDSIFIATIIDTIQEPDAVDKEIRKHFGQ